MTPSETRDDTPLVVETDPRFPSGPWTGFFLQPGTPERHWMEIDLVFRDGVMAGAGRDRVGQFAVSGRYHLDDGRAFWTKTYLRQHTLAYAGYNEGKGIWGTWEYLTNWRGGFHIWPVAMGDPTKQTLAAEAPAPPQEEPEPAPAAPIPVEQEAEPVGAEARLGRTLSAIRGR